MNKTPSHLSIVLLFSLVTLSTSGLAFAQTYRWVDKDGVTHFSEQAPDQEEIHSSNETKTLKPKTNQIHEKEEYLQKRASLEEQISGTINDERRDQLKRQLLVLDYQWYQEYDSEKAEELAKQLAAPKVRVLKNENEADKMSKYKAFY